MVTNRRKSPKKSPKNVDPDSSRDSDESDDPTAKLIIKVKNLKQNFIGDYVGRELVRHELFPEYKDIVIVNKDEDIIPTLDEIYETLHPQLETTWLGITRTTIDDEVQHYKLWTNLPGTPIGKHRFLIRAIKADHASIQLQLKVLNEFEISSCKSSWDGDGYSSFEVKEMSTYHNLCEIAKFCAVLIMSILTVAGNLLWYCGDYSLKVLRELSALIKVITPIIFGILDFMSKCVGGFYWLVYMLWRGDSDQPTTLPPITSNRSYRSNPPPLAIMPSSAPRRKPIILPAYGSSRGENSPRR